MQRLHVNLSAAVSGVRSQESAAKPRGLYSNGAGATVSLSDLFGRSKWDARGKGDVLGGSERRNICSSRRQPRSKLSGHLLSVSCLRMCTYTCAHSSNESTVYDSVHLLLQLSATQTCGRTRAQHSL